MDAMKHKESPVTLRLVVPNETAILADTHLAKQIEMMALHIKSLTWVTNCIEFLIS